MQPHERDAAVHERNRANSVARAASAQASGDPRIGVQMSLQALGYLDTPQAEQSLRNALPQVQLRRGGGRL
jgi:hypothetical protein